MVVIVVLKIVRKLIVMAEVMLLVVVVVGLHICKDSWCSQQQNQYREVIYTFNNLGILACTEWLAKQNVFAHSA